MGSETSYACGVQSILFIDTHLLDPKSAIECADKPGLLNHTVAVAFSALWVGIATICITLLKPTRRLPVRSIMSSTELFNEDLLVERFLNIAWKNAQLVT